MSFLQNKKISRAGAIHMEDTIGYINAIIVNNIQPYAITAG